MFLPMRQRALLVIVAVAAWSAGCASLPVGTYYPSPADPNTVRVSHILHRAAAAAGDDPTRYSFAFIKSQHAAAYTDEDATFYITDGLARLPSPVLEAAVAHEVAHEVLDHVGTRRRLALSLNAGFGTAGFFAPGVGLLDFVVNPLVVRAFSRQQEFAADQRAIEILRAMGNPSPRRSLAESLRAVDAVLVRTRDEGGSVLDTHPTLEDRLKALEPLEPAAVAEHHDHAHGHLAQRLAARDEHENVVSEVENHREGRHGQGEHEDLSKIAGGAAKLPDADQEPHRAQEPGAEADETVQEVRGEAAPEAGCHQLRHGLTFPAAGA